jgi:hypothetical protein
MSLVRVAAGVLFGLAGAALFGAGAAGLLAEPATTVGRALVSQGVMVAMVIGVAPVLVPVVLTGHRAPEGPTWPHILAHAAVRDIGHLRELVVEKIATRKEVGGTETSVIFEARRKPTWPCYVDARGPRRRAR